MRVKIFRLAENGAFFADEIRVVIFLLQRSV